MAAQPKDNFSAQAAAYAAFRPHYPQELYTYLFQLPGEQDNAWDCGTGNGQVAVRLAAQYRQVYATDISMSQLQHAPPKENISYIHCAAEKNPFSSNEIDLITVAQALHWFDFDRFYQEVQRVLKPGGILAVWGYGLLRINRLLNPLIDHFYTQVVGPYWDAERRHLDECYQSIPFPLPEIAAPDFQIGVTWSRQQLMGYLSSWSSVQHYLQQRGHSPLPELEAQVAEFWADGEEKQVQFPVFMRVGRKPE